MNRRRNAARPASPPDFDQKSTSTESSGGSAGVLGARNLVKLRIHLVQQDIARAADSAVELRNNLQAFPPEARLEDSIQRLDDLIPRLRTSVDLAAQLLNVVNALDPPAAN